MRPKVMFVLTVGLVRLAVTALGHWEAEDPYRWAQYPDLVSSGIDVNASFDLILADDSCAARPGRSKISTFEGHG